MRARHRLLVYALFLGSGATALVYQVSWARRLSLVVGASFEAVSIVLAAFMGGLALGSLVLGRRASQSARPLRFYGLLEIGVGVSALALPWLLGGVEAAYLAAAAALGEAANPALHALRAGLVFLLLVVPTFFMGGTLPVLIELVVDQEDGFRRRLANLYAINTAGAVVGAFGAGFVLLPALGLVRTEAVAILANLAIGALAFALDRAGDAPTRVSRAVPDSERLAAVSRDERVVLQLVFAGTVLCGFGALALEVMWTRAIQIAIGASIYSFTIMLGSFLIGIALGSALHARLPRGRLHEGSHFALLLGAIALSSLAVSFAIPRLPVIGLRFALWAGEEAGGVQLASSLGLCFLVMLVPCIFQGMAFPLAGEARVKLVGERGRSVGELLGLNTLGSIAGALAAGFVLVPLLGLQRGLLAISVLYASYAIVLGANLAARRHPSMRGLAAASALVAIAAVIAGSLTLPDWNRRLLASFDQTRGVARRVMREGIDRGLADRRVLFYREGRGSTISVVEYAEVMRSLLINGKVVASGAVEDLSHELLLGHLPVLLHPDPRSVLVVGLGAGVTLGAVTAHAGVETIDLVEIEPAVLDASRYFAHIHEDAPDDPRVRVRFDDGRNFLLTTRERFDVITADPIHPWTRGSAYLYAREYYQVARARLKEGGVMAQWLPLGDLSEDDLRAAVGSFVDVFPHSSLWLGQLNGVLVGSTAPLRISLSDWTERLAAAPVRRGLERAGLADALSLLSEFALDGAGLRGFAQGAVRNTDDNLLLEFSSPRHIGRRLSGSSYARLVERAADPLALVQDPLATFSGRDEALRTLAVYRGAKEATRRALREDDDQAVATLRAALETLPSHGRARLDLAARLRRIGRREFEDGRSSAAISSFREAAALAPFDGVALLELGYALNRDERLTEAIPVLEQARAQLASPALAHYELATAMLGLERRSEAITHLRAAAAARPDWADPINDLAWLLVTRPGASAGERAEALELATRAADLSLRRDASVLDTLAACNAANGRLSEAVRTARQALAVARPEALQLRSEIRERLASYEQRKRASAAPARAPQ